MASQSEHPNDDTHGPAALAVPTPLIGRSSTVSRRNRATGLLVAVAATAVIAVAAVLTPHPRDVGTHRQLGMPPCGFLLVSGWPCPTCGMTTSFAWMVHGHPIRALHAQPLGALLCLATLAAACVGWWMAASGRALVVDWWRITPNRMAIAVGLLFFAGWGGKILFGLLDGSLPYRP